MSEFREHYFFDDEIPRSVHGGGKLSTFCIALEAWRRDLRVTFLDPKPYEFQISDGSKTMSFDRGLPRATTREAFRACNDKSKARHLLHESGVPVANGVHVDSAKTSEQDIVEIAQNIGYPVVIKPSVGSKGRGVFTNIANDNQLSKYYRHVKESGEKRKLILEKHITGEDYRIQVVGNKVAAATWRRPAGVVGDGVQTVAQLVAEKNRKRNGNPALSRERIRRDLEVDQYLEDQGHEWQSIPEPNVRVRLRGKANLSTGGEIVDVTHLLPFSVQHVAICAVGAVPGLTTAGVDVMIDQEPEALDESAHCTVIELNPRAHIGGHMFPSEGSGHNAAGALVSFFFPESLRLNAKMAGRLSFDIDDVLAPLRSGVVERSTIAGLPVHRYPYRRVFKIPGLFSLRKSSRDLVSRSSRRWEIAGTLKDKDDSLELRVAGLEASVHEFCEIVGDEVGKMPLDEGPWEGVVWNGFKVSVPVEQS